MKKRRFLVLSLGLAILGLCAHLWAMGYVSRSVHLRARAVTMPEVERVQARADADSQLRRFPVFYYSGLAFAIAAVAFLVVSSRRHEPAWRSVSFALRCFYAMLQVVLI